MSLDEPEQFLTVGFGTPIDIGFLPATPGEDRFLPVDWRPKLGTSALPYDPDDVTGGNASG